jgi:hypothetical protein
MFARSVILATVLGACAGQATPTTMARLDSLPDEHVAREERLESTSARPGPETKRTKSKDFQHAETAAATAAAIVGSIFSTTQTVTIGVSQPIDENEILQPGYRDNQRPKSGEPAEPAGYDAGQLTPWVQLRKPAGQK